MSILIRCIIVRITDKAICIDVYGKGEWLEWLPKSQIKYSIVDGKYNLFDIKIPEWLAYEKGIGDAE